MRKSTSAVNTRRTAAFILLRWLATKDFPAAMLPQGRDRAFVQDVVYTAIRRLRPLRHVLGEFVKTWPKGELEALLYVGAAQLLYMDDVPDFAAVNETVEAAKACENPAVARVVNGVLRNLLRRREEVEARLAAAPLEVRESFPTALVRRWQARFGADGAERLARRHNEPSVTYLAFPDGRFEPLARGRRVEEVPGYAEGAFIVQDPATQLAVGSMDVRPGERVLDACAAPGGKAVQLAWRGAAVTACEVNPKRRARLEENVRRVGLADKIAIIPNLPIPNSSTFQPFNSSTVQPFNSSTLFDKVLVDAPCSNTGVLRRRPDARWNWSDERLAALVRLQAEILDQCAPLVKPGGLLVYSTCSNEWDENTGQVEAFLSRHPDFEKIGVGESVPHEGAGWDGAFAATLRRHPGPSHG